MSCFGCRFRVSGLGLRVWGDQEWVSIAAFGIRGSEVECPQGVGERIRKKSRNIIVVVVAPKLESPCQSDVILGFRCFVLGLFWTERDIMHKSATSTTIHINHDSLWNRP